MCHPSSLGGHETRAERTEPQSIPENLNWNLQWNNTHFSDWPGKGSEIPAHEKNQTFEAKSAVGPYRDSLLTATVQHSWNLSAHGIVSSTARLLARIWKLEVQILQWGQSPPLT